MLPELFLKEEKQKLVKMCSMRYVMSYNRKEIIFTFFIRKMSVKLFFNFAITFDVVKPYFVKIVKSKKKLFFNTNYRREMKLAPITMDYCLH